MSKPETYEFVVPEESDGQRLDKALAGLIDHLSRARIQALIAEEQVCVDGVVCTGASYKLKENQRLSLIVPPPVSWYPEPEDIPLDIVFEDEDVVVINKPAGLVVHPGAGHQTGTLVHALLHHVGDRLSGIGGVLRPGIVHRLDKDTSGLMVVAKNDQAHQFLSDQFAGRSLSRKYKALVLGVPMPLKGSVEGPIGRHTANRQKMSVRRQGGKDAVTHYRVLDRFGDALSLVECVLESGRTHQIRVHMAHIRFPLIGDPLYGPQKTAVEAALRRSGYDEFVCKHVIDLSRQMLHAYALSFIHPGHKKTMSFEASLSPDMQAVLDGLKVTSNSQ